MVPLIKQAIKERPNMSNKECSQLLSPYVRKVFLTSQILQAARSTARFEIFGDPVQNAQYIDAMIREANARGHVVQSVMRTPSEVMSMLETIVVKEESERIKASQGIVMTKAMKIAYKDEWLRVNKDMLQYAGLGIPMFGVERPMFCGGIFFAMSFSKHAVPYLQNVFQADAAHCNFGKYTLYSCYGTTANCNTAPVAFGILFGNEDKDGWEAFWKFALTQHVGLNHRTKTYITDQAKGLVESVKGVMKEAGHFHCSYHRRKNILTYCKGGTKPYSATWLYDKLMFAKTKAEIEHIKKESAPFMSDRVLNYVNNLPDDEQYPAARVDVSGNYDIYMYQRSASSSVESMNRANKAARDRTAVDVVQSMKLLIDLETNRFNEKKEMVWNWTEELTPHGIKLRDDVFAKVDFRLYQIDIAECDDRWECKVKRGRGRQRRCFFLKDTRLGSHFGGCRCNAPCVDGLPCHHMVAVVKSARINGLTPNNSMPEWWTTEMWRKQYPQDVHSLNDFCIESLKLSEQGNQSMRYCPPFVAPNKSGRPKEGKRKKGSWEETKPKKRKSALSEAVDSWEAKKSKIDGGSGAKRGK